MNKKLNFAEIPCKNVDCTKTCVPRPYSPRKYCSRKCYFSGRKLVLITVACGAPECRKEFLTDQNYPHKFCSRGCYDKHRPTREDTTASVEALRKFYKTTKGAKSKIERGKKISASQKRRFSVTLSDEDIKRLSRIGKLKYIRNSSVLISQSGISKTPHELQRFIRYNPEYESVFLAPKHYAGWLQKFPFLEMELLQKDVNQLFVDEIREKYNLTKYQHSYIVRRLGLRALYRPWWEANDGAETSIEAAVRYLLESLNIKFWPQCRLYNEGGASKRRFRVDFMLENRKVIEVQGDYWHANPEVFDMEKLTGMQKGNVLRDLEKASWLKLHGYTLLQVWERDIRMFPDFVESTIKHFIYG